jgi:hypothetical protein
LSQCQSCAGRSTLFLCPQCTGELQAQLYSLAHGLEVNGRSTTGLLDALADVALKRTCMGGGTGHRKRGDELPSPFEGDTDKGHQTPQGRAAMLLDSARNMMTTIMREVCESRGVDVLVALRVIPRGFIGPLLPGWRRVTLNWRPETSELAKWLARNVHALACDESAGQWRAEVESLTRGIERAIDRPIGRKYLGPCPTWNEQTRKVCKAELWAPADAIDTFCRACRQTHNCNRLQLLLIGDLERSRVTINRILELNRILPEEYRIPERTLRHWRTPGKDGKPPKLRPKGYLRPDGRIVINRHTTEDEPVFLWSDVRRLRVENGRKDHAAK